MIVILVLISKQYSTNRLHAIIDNFHRIERRPNNDYSSGADIKWLAEQILCY